MASALGIAQIVAAGAAGVAASVAVWQSRMTQHQLNVTMRPWLSVVFKAIDPATDASRISIPFKNHGQTPALNVRVRAGALFEQITKEMLETKEYTPGISVVVPESSRVVAVDIDKEGQKKILAGEYVWLGILIQYEYSRKGKGEYGLIGEYNFRTHHDRTNSEWAK